MKTSQEITQFLERSLPGTCAICGVTTQDGLCTSCKEADWKLLIKRECATCGKLIPGTLSWYKVQGNFCDLCSRRATLSAIRKTRMEYGN